VTRVRAAELRQALHNEREALLQRILQILRQDERVTAVWLFGSLGRIGKERRDAATGVVLADDLSDLDLWVVVADEHLETINKQRRPYVAQVAEPLLVVEASRNAPAGGAYLMAVYAGEEAGPYIVDWYWQPASAAAVATDPRFLEARLLFERAGYLEPGPSASPPAAVRKQDHEPPLTEAQRRAEEARNLTSVFWAMLLVSAKYAVRQGSDEEMVLHDMLRGLLHETREFAGSTRVEVDCPPPPTPPVDKLHLLRCMAAEMETLMPQIVAQGGEVPWAIVGPAHRYLDLAQVLVAAKQGQDSPAG
jgi:predicted nucleotidyltransferase